MFYQVSKLFVRPFLALGFRPRGKGAANVPKKGAAILASNHLSFLDHFILGHVVPRQIFFISKVQHFERPIRRFLFTKWGVIPLRRGEGDDTAMQRSIEVLNRGDLFAIYPEGTRSLDGKLHKGHTGVARLHLVTGAPIIPVAMWGTFDALPKGRSVPRLKACGAKIGKPLQFPQYKGKEGDRKVLREITDAVMEAIQELGGQEYVDEYQFNPEVPSHRKGEPHGAPRA